MKKTKLIDIAQSAGVSLSTVSMALSGKGRISKEVRERVLTTCKKLGYEKKQTGSNQSSSKRVGIFLQFDGVWAHTLFFLRPLLLSLENTFKAEGYMPILLPINYQMANEELLQMVAVADICALFSIHYGNEELFNTLEHKGIPIILINNDSFQNKFYAVCVDDFLGAYEGTLYLIQKGHRKIAFIEYERPDMPSLLSNRFVGFKKALDEHRLGFPNKYRVTISMKDISGLQKSLSSLFTGNKKPSALFVHDDRFAAYVITTLQTLGISVPEDVSIIAPGDVLDYDEPYITPITTMRINTALMGKIAAESMLNRLRNHPDDVHVLNVKQQLVERGSCRTAGPAI
jgi:DNA-binding LacI/PurR family transcriptional regulator